MPGPCKTFGVTHTSTRQVMCLLSTRRRRRAPHSSALQAVPACTACGLQLEESLVKQIQNALRRRPCPHAHARLLLFLSMVPRCSPLKRLHNPQSAMHTIPPIPSPSVTPKPCGARLATILGRAWGWRRRRARRLPIPAARSRLGSKHVAGITQPCSVAGGSRPARRDGRWRQRVGRAAAGLLHGHRQRHRQLLLLVVRLGRPLQSGWHPSEMYPWGWRNGKRRRTPAVASRARRRAIAPRTSPARPPDLP